MTGQGFGVHFLNTSFLYVALKQWAVSFGIRVSLGVEAKIFS